MLSNKEKGIYSITHKVNGKRYIGSTYSNLYDRWCAHRSTLHRKCHSSILLQRAWEKYGSDAFEFEIIEICRENLHVRELHYINSFKSSDPIFGYNISKETNNARLGHQQSDLTKQRISSKLKGIRRSDETRQRIATSKTGINNPMFGKKQSNEYIEKRTKNNKKPIVRDDGKTYLSIKEAALDIGALEQGVSQSLRKGHKVSGYRFFYEP